MKKTITLSPLFCFLLFLPSLSGQQTRPATNALRALADDVSEQFSTIATDSNITFEQVQPFLAALFESYRAKSRRMKVGKPEQRYIFIVTADGLRWQEIFSGADSALLNNPACTSNPPASAARYWADRPEERRQKLMPFLWSVFGQRGQIYGNRQHGNLVNVSNRIWISYPGYNEMFTGQTDDKHIFANVKVHNPNTNVLEYLNKHRGFRNKVAAFGTWEVFSYIFNEKRANFPVYAGDEIDRIDGTLHPDESTWATACAYIQRRRPHAVFIGLDDTDRYAHDGDYDQYLDAANRADTWIAELWSYIQNNRKYRDKTTLIITTDHGRGSKAKQWRDHHFMVEGSDEIWFAVIGPDTPAGGEMRQPMQIWQKQFAQTIAGLSGCNFSCSHKVAPKIESVFKTGQEIPVNLAIKR